MKLRRLASFAAASAVIIGLLGQGASAVLAADNTQYWQGQGVTDGQINNSDCNEDSSAHMLWIWTGDLDAGEDIWINVDGELVKGAPQGQGAYHFATGWHDIAGLVPGDNGNVFVTYNGTVDDKAQLTLSHGCEGTTTTTSSSSSTTTTETGSSSSTTTTETGSSTTTTTETGSSTTTTTETGSSSTTTSFSQTVSGTTDKQTLPNTATVEIGGPSSPSSNVWLLIVALGLVLGSVVILTPAPSKTKR